MVNLERAKQDPSSQFKSPHDVVVDQSLTREEKIDILLRWEYDQREIAVAEEENMVGARSNHHNILEKIHECLLELKFDVTKEGRPPTKQG